MRALSLQVRLYMDCEEYHRVAFARSAQPLTFEPSSGIFVGNAGGTGLARFVVSLDGSLSTVVFVPECSRQARIISSHNTSVVSYSVWPSVTAVFLVSLFLIPNVTVFGSVSQEWI